MRKPLHGDEWGTRPHENARPVTKVEQYKWETVGEPGRFVWLPKGQLHIDREYQREKVSAVKVLAIASEWVWPSVGVLSVAARPDGTYWVFDGQHRKLAADKRADIQSLPCMVYEMGDKLTEALSFLKINTFRTSMLAIDKMNAELIAQDPIAVAVRQMVESTGYAIASPTSGGTANQRVVKCVAVLKQTFRKNPVHAQAAWKICVALFDGKVIVDRVYAALFNLEAFLAKRKAGSLLEAHNFEALTRCTVAVVQKSINESMVFYGGGPKAGAEGIVRLINKGRRTRRLPSLYGVPTDAE